MSYDEIVVAPLVCAFGDGGVSSVWQVRCLARRQRTVSASYMDGCRSVWRRTCISSVWRESMTLGDVSVVTLCSWFATGHRRGLARCAVRSSPLDNGHCCVSSRMSWQSLVADIAGVWSSDRAVDVAIVWATVVYCCRARAVSRGIAGPHGRLCDLCHRDDDVSVGSSSDDSLSWLRPWLVAGLAVVAGSRQRRPTMSVDVLGRRRVRRVGLRR
jgi:hypothetical protein